ncbi:hypothetical protein ACKFKG_22960 [Phormidesmis sp. 146-35]
MENDRCEDLERLKLYRVIPDDVAAQKNFIRVIDESGEDYLYPSSLFVLVEFPQAVEEKLMAVALQVS